MVGGEAPRVGMEGAGEVGLWVAVLVFCFGVGRVEVGLVWLVLGGGCICKAEAQGQGGGGRERQPG